MRATTGTPTRTTTPPEPTGARFDAAPARRYWHACAAALSGRADALTIRRDECAAFARWIADNRLGVLLQDVCRAGARDHPIWAELSGPIHRELAVSALQERELRRLLDACAAATIAPVLLKGAALAYTAYENPAVRPRADVDLLIRASDRPALQRVLIALGYQTELDVPTGFVSSQIHFSRSDVFGVQHAVDVHLKMSNALAYADFLTYDEILEQAIRCPRLHPTALAPSPIHCLLIACVHRIAHHHDDDDLIWLWDIHRLASALGTTEWSRVIELSRTRRLSAAVARGLERASDAFGPSGAGRAVEQLAADALRTADARPEFSRQTRMIDVVVSDLRTLKSAADRIRLLRDHLFPPLSYVREKYPQWPAALLPFAYAYRIGRGAPKWFRPRRR